MPNVHVNHIASECHECSIVSNVCFTVVSAAILKSTLRLFIGCPIGSNCDGNTLATPNGAVGATYCNPRGFYGNGRDAYITIGTDTDAVGTFIYVLMDGYDLVSPYAPENTMTLTLQMASNIDIMAADGVYSVVGNAPITSFSGGQITVAQNEGAKDSIVAISGTKVISMYTVNRWISNTFFYFYIKNAV